MRRGVLLMALALTAMGVIARHVLPGSPHPPVRAGKSVDVEAPTPAPATEVQVPAEDVDDGPVWVLVPESGSLQEGEPIRRDMAVLVDGDGQELRRIPLLEALERSGQ